MQKIKLTIQYDGTNYLGWQSQAYGNTIQKEIENQLSSFLGGSIKVIGSGRTDSGVHARGQVAHFMVHRAWDPEKILYILNAKLPKDIRIIGSESVDLDFHARYQAKRREYHYVIYNDLECSPFIKNYVYIVRKRLNIKKLIHSLKFFLGEKDFSSLCCHSDEERRSKTRLIYNIGFKKENAKITILMTGNGFLRKMVRMIIGLVLDINIKDLPAREVIRVLELKNRKEHDYSTVPPHGLFLNRVWYE